MNPETIGEIILLVFLIGVNAFFAAAEISIISVSKARLRQLLEEGVPAARLIHDLADNSTRLLSTIQVGVTLASFFAAATTAVTLAPELAGWLHSSNIRFLMDHAMGVAVIVITFVLAVIVLILGEFVPKNLAQRNSEGVALVLVRPLAVIALLFAPFVSFLNVVTDLILRLLGGRQTSSMPFVTEEEIKTLVDAGEETGVLEESEKDMIYGVFDLGETTVREIMVPRVDMAMIDVEMPLRQAATTAANLGHSRLPIFESNPDTIVGVLHVKDLLRVLASDKPVPSLRSIMRTPYFVPESKRVDDLLRDMQRMNIYIAIVIDEYGGTAGLATIEDVLEEIVGEIRHERQPEDNQADRVDDSTVIFSGRVSLDDVNEMLDLDLADDGVDTIGGFLASRLGKVPVRGDRLELDAATLEVMTASGRRVKRIRVARKPRPAEQAEE